MKTVTKLLALFAATALCTLAPAASFVRASVSYFYFENPLFDSKTAFGIAGGSTFGEKNAHEVSLEWIHCKWEFQNHPSAPLVGAPWDDGTGNLQPILVNYRYHFGSDGAKVHFHVGASAGFTRIKGNLTRSLSGLRFQGGFSEWKPAFGPCVGLQVDLTRNVALDVSYRYLHASGVDGVVVTSGASSLAVDLGSIKAQVFMVGLSSRF